MGHNKITHGKSLTEYHDEGNRMLIGFTFVEWLMGLTGNCSLRSFHALAVVQEICQFDAGECQLINVNSFGSHQALLDCVSGNKATATTEWTIVDAKAGIVGKGTISIH